MRDLASRTFQFACDVTRLCVELESRGGLSSHVARQLFDSATSVGANYEESQAASSRREFLAKQHIVLREARESHFWLRVVLACKLARSEPTRALVIEAGELVAIFTASTRTAKIALGRLPPR